MSNINDDIDYSLPFGRLFREVLKYDLPSNTLGAILESLKDENQDGRIAYEVTTGDSAGNRFYLSLAHIKAKINRGSDVEDENIKNVVFYPSTAIEVNPKRETKFGNRGIFEIIDNEYIYSSLGKSCLEDCFVKIYPNKEKEIREYYRRKKRSGSTKALTMASKNLGLSVSYYGFNKGGNNNTRRLIKNKETTFYLALINPYTGSYPETGETAHWIFIKPEFQANLNVLGCTKIEKQIATVYKDSLKTMDLNSKMLSEISYLKQHDTAKKSKMFSTYVFDLETYNDEVFKLYACGYKKFIMYHKNGIVNREKSIEKIDQFETKITTGQNAIIDMLCEIDADPDVRDDEQIYMYAHNGSRFDVYIMLQNEDIFNEFEPKSMIKAPSGIINFVLSSKRGVKFIFRDTQRHINGSLDKICKQFNLPVQKGSMDHNKITKDNWNDLRHEWEPYLIKDVESLAYVVLKINELYTEVGLRGKLYPPVVEHLSSPGAAMSYCLQEGFKAEKHLNPYVRDFIDKAKIGGRVQACIQEYVHPEWEQILAGQGYEMQNTNEGLIALDANSLYPSAMAEGPLHVGGSFIYEGTTEELLKTNMHIIAEIDEIIPPKNLLFPILPIRQKDGSLVWSNENIYDGTYSNIDLQQAYLAGYKIGNIKRAIAWSHTSDALTNCMKKLYEERLKVKKTNPIKSEAIKLISNSTYGKMVQKDINTKVKFSRSLLKEPGVTHHTQIGQWILNEMKPLNNDPFKVGGANQVGVEILAKSKRIMTNIARECDMLFNPVIFYSDTDSIYVHKRHLPTVDKYCGPHTGQFKNDYGENEFIVYGKFLCPKVKLCVTYNSATKKLKPHVTFRGYPYKPCASNNEVDQIKYMIKQFKKFENGELVNENPQWKRSLKIGVCMPLTEKRYARPNNKRCQPMMIKGVNKVMTPLGYKLLTEPEKQTLIIKENDNPEATLAKQYIEMWKNHEIDKLCITGGPGTGKTTLMKSLNNTYTIVTPTNMAKSLYSNAKTIHQFLRCYHYSDDVGNIIYSSTPIIHQCVCKVHGVDCHNANNCPENFCECASSWSRGLFEGITPLTFENCDEVIVDEFSMVDRQLIKSAKRIIIVGDINQLEPVDGETMTTNDFADFHVVELKKNYRATDPEIYKAALKDPINCIKNLPAITRDECYKKRIPILCWRNKTVNEYRQVTYPKPYMIGKKTNEFDNGQIVIVNKPMVKLTDKKGIISYVFDTNKGTITSYSPPNLKALFKKKIITRQELNSFSKAPTLFPASAFTTHKAQGQSFDAVAICKDDMLVYASAPFYSYKLPYTAITRGRKTYVVD